MYTEEEAVKPGNKELKQRRLYIGNSSQAGHHSLNRSLTDRYMGERIFQIKAGPLS
jgi:hypothetical protein